MRRRLAQALLYSSPEAPVRNRGERMAQTLVPQLTKALLRTSGLRRAPEPEGRVRYKGPFPDRLVLELGAKPR